MGAIVSELLAEALALRRSTRAAPSFRWTSRAMKSRVDLSDKEAVYAALGAGFSVSYSLDSNVLLYASDRSSDRHERVHPLPPASTNRSVPFRRTGPLHFSLSARRDEIYQSVMPLAVFRAQVLRQLSEVT